MTVCGLGAFLCANDEEIKFAFQVQKSTNAGTAPKDRPRKQKPTVQIEINVAPGRVAREREAARWKHPREGQIH